MLRPVTIPAGLDFSDLRLSRLPDGAVEFSWQAIDRICQASGIPMETFTDSPEDTVAALITHWYHEHRQRGGAPDPVAEDLIAEMLAEDQYGGGQSYPPGSA